MPNAVPVGYGTRPAAVHKNAPEPRGAASSSPNPSSRHSSTAQGLRARMNRDRRQTQPPTSTRRLPPIKAGLQHGGVDAGGAQPVGGGQPDTPPPITATRPLIAISALARGRPTAAGGRPAWSATPCPRLKMCRRGAGARQHVGASARRPPVDNSTVGSGCPGPRGRGAADPVPASSSATRASIPIASPASAIAPSSSPVRRRNESSARRIGGPSNSRRMCGWTARGRYPGAPPHHESNRALARARAVRHHDVDRPRNRFWPVRSTAAPSCGRDARRPP